eukprot:TRINITY_DN10295_c0_g1_i1.p1 TRINITY_DN10295_c0_g1~~TRINITY_DN10295_c0_g1_i1.p1  ORF type:complete len:414 (+),score=37.39 TRINITY_DN10295_c0_g1_i1:69-1310(+)
MAVESVTRRIASEISSPSDERPVCLDYLKGLCSRRRWKCKYAHPELPDGIPEVVEPSDTICKVWMLTGFCKFGPECHFSHPGMQTRGRRTSISSSGSNNVSDVESDETPKYTHNPYRLQSLTSTSPPGSLPSSPESCSSVHSTSSKKVLSILNRITVEKFEGFCFQLISMLSLDMISLEVFFPLVVRKASKEPLNVLLYARLCQRLIAASPRSQLESSRKHLWDLILEGVNCSESEKHERLGHIQLLGELFNVGLATESRITTMLDMIMEKISSDDTDSCEAEFNVELTCKLLTSAGRLLDARWPRVVDFFVEQLQNKTKSLSNRVQVLVLNLMELQKVHNWQKERPQDCQQVEPPKVPMMPFQQISPVPWLPPQAFQRMVPQVFFPQVCPSPCGCWQPTMPFVPHLPYSRCH